MKYSPCWQHRGSGGFSSSSSSSASQGWSGSEAAATSLADALTDGISEAIASRVANRVADYLGRLGAWRLRRQRRWAAVDCQALADSARAVLALKQKAHELTGQAVSALLPEGTPRFHRILVRKIAEKVPLPWDVKLEAIARGLQVIGIWMCLVQNLPLEHCPCLQMYGVARFRERIEQEIEDLLEETRRDLQSQTHR